MDFFDFFGQALGCQIEFLGHVDFGHQGVENFEGLGVGFGQCGFMIRFRGFMIRFCGLGLGFCGLGLRFGVDVEFSGPG